MKKLNILLISIMVLSLYACSSVPTSLNASMRRQYETLHVVVMPPNHAPTIYTSGQELAGLVGFAFGGAMASSEATAEAAKQPSIVFGEFLKKNNINIADIVQTELNSQLVNSGYFRIGDKTNADAVLTVTIGGYGFAQKSLWSDYERSQLYLNSTLRDGNGKLIATFRGYATPFRNDIALTAKQILTRPNEVRGSFTRTAAVAVRDIVKKMTEK